MLKIRYNNFCTLGYRQAVRHWTLTPTFGCSNHSTPAKCTKIILSLCIFNIIINGRCLILKRLIGDKTFYKQLFVLALPIMLQNGITNFVNMLDNIMVGRIGTAEMTGIAVSNQLLLVFNLCIFGAVSGAGIFGAQFYGKDDREGVRDTFRFKVIFCSLLCIAGVLILFFFNQPLISLYLKGEGSKEQALSSLNFAKKYIMIMLIGLIPYTLSQCYASTLRETGKALPPMYAGIVAVFINLILNVILIFGYLGAPKLGVAGAAVATVISRFIELFVIAFWTHKNAYINQFITDAYKSLRVPVRLVKDILKSGAPLMLNETLWAAGIAFLNQCYSVKGLSVVAANNISQTFFNVFSVAFMAIGAAIGIILGQILGSEDMKKAKEYSVKLIATSFIISVVVGIVFALCAEFIPHIYNTTDEVKHLATRLMQITALFMPIDAVANSCYFTLRSGGKTLITFIFDSVFIWIISIPAALLISNFTSLNILALYIIVQGLNIIKNML